MSRTRSPTRRCAGPEPPATTGRSPKRPARKAIAASSIADLRERVDTAASLLSDVGNVHQLADLLTAAAYAALCLGSEHDAADFAARATPIARALDNPFARMINSGNLGLAALLTGETDTASHAFREELALCRDMVVRPVVFEGLRGLAAVAVVDGDDTRAATLVGAADAHRYDQARGSGRRQARRGVLRARPHTVRDRRMERRRARRQRVELRGRDRLRPRGGRRLTSPASRRGPGSGRGSPPNSSRSPRASGSTTTSTGPPAASPRSPPNATTRNQSSTAGRPIVGWTPCPTARRST